MGEAQIENRSAGEEDAMKRTWMEPRKVHRERRWIEVLPLDPRDLDVVRAKGLASRKKDLVVVGPLERMQGPDHLGAAPSVPNLERA
jgi:hypothetical protein